MAKALPKNPDKDTKNKEIKTAPKNSPFQKSQRIQGRYAKILFGVAKEIGKLIKGYAPTDILQAERLRAALRQYSDIIGPWALKISFDVLNDVDRQDKATWQAHSNQMSVALKQELLNAPTGDLFQQLMKEQVGLIKSIPIQAADRVHKLVSENLYQGQRAESIMEKILQTEKVSESRAKLIARTEIARASTKLLEARAQHVGSDGYIWRTAKDLIVRPSHKKMNGVFVKWSEPPTLDKMTGHAGCLPNCRCYADPVLPDAKF